MRVWDRMKRLLEAELHAALDAAEDPEVMMAQAAREAAEEVAEGRRRMNAAEAAQAAREEEKHREWATHLQWEARAEKAMSAGHEQLAGEALVFSLKHKEAAVHLEAEITTGAVDLEAMRTAQRVLEQQEAALRERHDELLARLRSAQVDDLAAGYGRDGESPLDLYARMEAKLKGTAYRAEAAGQMAEDALAARLDALHAESGPSAQVQQKLADLKARLGKS